MDNPSDRPEQPSGLQDDIPENIQNADLGNLIDILRIETKTGESFISSEIGERVELDEDLDPFGEIWLDDFLLGDPVKFYEPELKNKKDLISIDVGATKIGETSDGPLVAFRGAIIHIKEGERIVYICRTGPMLLSFKRKADILSLVGENLGKKDLFVNLDPNGNPVSAKKGAADNSNQYSDRIRNLIERKLQEIAVKLTKDGIIFLDGALTSNTRDTPDYFIRNNLIKPALDRGNYIFAVSKKSTKTVKGKQIRFLLEDNKDTPEYLHIQPSIDEEAGAVRNFGQMYAVRFAPIAETYRVDVCIPEGIIYGEAFDEMMANTAFRNGYPEILVRAHLHTYVTWSALVSMKADAVVRYNLKVVSEISLSGAFAPFGGGFK